MSGPDLSGFSMLDLFRAELETQSQALTEGLLALERNPVAADHLEAAMRAAHSLKGAARIIELEPAVRVAHAMEECLVAAQRGRLRLGQEAIDALLKGVDLLALVASDGPNGGAAAEPAVARFLATLDRVLHGTQEAASTAGEMPPPAAPFEPPPAEPAMRTEPGDAVHGGGGSERMVRITAEAMNRLLGLAGESLMEARRLRPFLDRLTRLTRQHAALAKAFDELRAVLPPNPEEEVADALVRVQDRLGASHDALAERLAELDALDLRASDLANRLYAETLESRMGPFEDGVRHYARTIRDLGRTLGKRVRLDIVGGSTGIDRDILEQLDAPLGHLLRNAVDHAIELPDERAFAGKPVEGVIRVEARHSAGLLQILVSDDGRGIDTAQLRRVILARGLTTPETAAQLSEAELLEFLFLPGFSLKETVSDISGRGVGLDAVQAMTRAVRGQVSISSTAGIGTTFQLELPLTLSVMRTLLVEVANEPYAFPLAGIAHTLRLPRTDIAQLEGRSHFRFGERQIGLIACHEILERGEPKADQSELAVIVIGDGEGSYGVVVDRFLGERELVVRPLDARLGKIKDISAAALLDDGAPVLIIDVEDMLRSAEKLSASGRLRALNRTSAAVGARARKRVLVVDDSLTVRELERKLLAHHGYEVEVAVDGMDGWNAVRSEPFDLVVTDVDMPRMDGIELLTLIKRDARLGVLPVMIVSYKDREEDRRRGLDAGADYYLTKGSFHDDALVGAVADLIGTAYE
ncbi:hybrid sensor histidine kinase/response regulator [Ancylobacter sp. 6x-1]|uniref:histidine kinase n=1 Tax=Ancylobacter crimeensis TaxID=2579147 RepID=A0ABT0D8Y9_9HYPH|nr:hybrid sensor histidine kinase/response regulator [Ancylobacter crimeensis]MCK0196418.1 hybrid sensor histidine kinase/response regulator [Ancylobacter crimeensis]